MIEPGKLRWRCRRGMKELDLLLQDYLDARYPTAPPREQRLFAELLELQDPELHAWLLGRESPADPGMAAVIDQIRAAAHP